jgi:hypothetical protein
VNLLLTSTGVPSLHEGLWRQSLESDRRQILVTTLFEHAGGEAALHRLRISIHCEKHRTGPGRAIKINGECESIGELPRIGPSRRDSD